ncbi:AMP-binding protein [Anderseniella sp. Alg231-50]|uniref:AMP-binding protein n=1 Tax=Anderseniella sp. Alg231-50 TaxID=1922226 RepID=UPI000D5525C2
MTPPASPQKDRFVHDRLPPREQWPQIQPLAASAGLDTLNCVSLLLDRHVSNGNGDSPAIRGGDRTWTYAELDEHVCRTASVMVHRYAIEPGNRVLIRGGNSPEVALIWLAVQKIGAVAVTTMSLLRDNELRVIIDMSQPALAICETSLMQDLSLAVRSSGRNVPVIGFEAGHGELFELMADASPQHETCATLPDDISLIAFTSGTTGKPKATVHFHRDVIAICETMCRHMVAPDRQDVFIGTAPLAFTFGLGGLLVFPLHAGACSVLNARYSPEQLLDAIETYGATVCFTVPTFFQQMVKLKADQSLATLRLAVSSGEALPLPVRQAWADATGMQLAEVLGSTEMLHAFAGSTGQDVRAGFIGPAIPGFELAVVDDTGRKLPANEIGRLAVRGPTGCRYLDDARQQAYVQHGWNITGDACSMTEDGYLAYHSRLDDMIISSGYNISGVEVENTLLLHPHVRECAVVGEASEERGQVVVAYVVTPVAVEDRSRLAGDLQDHVKNTIAPYKYPRAIRFLDQLPRNESGKIQRFRLRGS